MLFLYAVMLLAACVSGETSFRCCKREWWRLAIQCTAWMSVVLPTAGLQFDINCVSADLRQIQFENMYLNLHELLESDI